MLVEAEWRCTGVCTVLLVTVRRYGTGLMIWCGCVNGGMVVVNLWCESDGVVVVAV